MEKVVTIGLWPLEQSARSFSNLMKELERLVETAGGRVIKEFFQKRAKPDPATLIGKGKAEEIRDAIRKMGIKTVVFDDDLTAAQQKNIEKIIPAKILDRTRLILDIFARRARTREGQLQVELAQLNYLVPRLTGAWRGFSQQMGGIGTRGPGERKIEVERRYVRERIKKLKKEIEEVRNHRFRVRESRQSVPLPQVALVGYTNVGKSTLLNTLVGKENMVYADDKLFATLDPTTRRVKLPGGRTVLFTDTVGFIQKLPHHLVDAFHATLEEVSESSLLVHVVDGTTEDQIQQMATVIEVIKSLNANHIPILTAINKADRLPPAVKDSFLKKKAILVSAKTGEGMSEFLTAVQKNLDDSLLDISFNLPYTHQHLMGDIYQSGYVVSQQSTKAGTALRIRMNAANWKKIAHKLNGTYETQKEIQPNAGQ